MDEKTLHIHATVIPIVTGQRRKAGKDNASGKKKYRPKSTIAPRLCADDVMARNKLKEYQDSYADAMKKYGLRRGRENSQSNHISTREYYNDLINNRQSIQEDVEKLLNKQKELQKQEQVFYDMRDNSRDKFYAMDSHVQKKMLELAELEQRAEKAVRTLNPDRYKEDLELLLYLKPELEQVVKISAFCIDIGISKDLVRLMLTGQSLDGSGELYSHEFERSYHVEEGVLRIERDMSDPYRLTLKINGEEHVEWFRQQYKEEMKNLGVDLDSQNTQTKQNR